LTGDQNRKYIIEKKSDLLVFSTDSFIVEKSSVLHSGIYNKEFASMLVSAVVAGALYMILTMNSGHTVLTYVLTALLFITGFPFFRKFVFKDIQMETVFDLTAGRVEIYLKSLKRKLKESFSVNDVAGIVIEQKKEKIGNPDGVAFVERISLQHGAVIPGLAEEKIFYILKLKLADSTDRMIYADSSMQDVIEAHGEIKDFLKI
jgi:hypothetical protein